MTTQSTAKVAKLGNTKEAMADWDARTMNIWGQIREEMNARGRGVVPNKAICKSFIIYSARLSNDPQQSAAFIDELFGFLADPNVTWESLHNYLQNPHFVHALAPCASRPSGPYLPCFDYFRDFVLTPSKELLEDTLDNANVDEFEREEPEFKKQCCKTLGIDDQQIESGARCHQCGGCVGTVMSIQTRSNDEGSAMRFICGKKSCLGLMTNIDKD